MKQKIKLLLVFLFSSECVHADFFPYIALTANIEKNRISESIKTEDVTFGLFNTTHIQLSHNKRKITPQPSIGIYGFLDKKNALSLDLSYSPALKSKLKSASLMPLAGLSFSESFKKCYGLNFALKWHYFITSETNIFLGTGLSLERYKTKGSLTRNVGNNVSFKDHFTVNQPNFFLGAEHKFSNHVLISAYTKYKHHGNKKHYIRQHINPGTGDLFQSTHEFKPKPCLSFGVQLKYQF